MNRFKKAFKGQKNIFLVAIHVGLDETATAADIEIARAEGTDGIIVIRDYNTQATNEDVLGVYDYARERYPRWWIGINLLGYLPLEAVLKVKRGTSGVWFDQSYIKENKPESVDYLEGVRMKSDIFHLDSLLLLPSIAMKYQEKVRDIAGVAKLAEPYADVLITSGDATGMAADFDKVKALRSAVKVPIGLASGVSVENVGQYIDLGVDLFIVNTSISTNGRLDQKKVGALRDKIPR